MSDKSEIKDWCTVENIDEEIKDWCTVKNVNSWSKLQKHINTIEKNDKEWVHRGQGNAGWALRPSLERVACERFRIDWENIPETEKKTLTRIIHQLKK